MDIKSIFLQVDRLSKRNHSEFSMHECCKDAADLHERVNRYYLHSNNLFVFFELVFFFVYVQIHASTDRCDKCNHFHDGHTIHNLCMFWHVHNREGESFVFKENRSINLCSKFSVLGK